MKIIKNPKTGLLALATDDGKRVTKYEYTIIEPANQYGLHKVMRIDDEGPQYGWDTNECWGYINSKGKEVVPTIWCDKEAMGDYDENGYCEIYYEDRSALYSTTGSVFKFDYPIEEEEFFEGIIIKMPYGVYITNNYTNEKFGMFASKSGKVVDFDYDDISCFNVFGVAKTTQDKLTDSNIPFAPSEREPRYGIINYLGVKILPCEYRQIIGLPNGIDHSFYEENISYDQQSSYATDKTYRGLVLIENEAHEWGAINLGSEQPIKLTFKYESVNTFDGNYCAVKDSKTHYWGVIDVAANEVVPCKYNTPEEALKVLADIAEIAPKKLIEQKFVITKRKK